MSGFSTDWLSMREAADKRARNRKLADLLSAWFAMRDTITVVDIGCGTGANLRATCQLLSPKQTWRLIDYDPGLLAAARAELISWADHSVDDGAGLALEKDGKSLEVSFCQVDLSTDLGKCFAGPADLVTASAFFDLVSVEFIRSFVDTVAAHGSTFYAVLTYNGLQSWTPRQPDDNAMTGAFHAHQMSDKGFGAAAGPTACSELSEAFRRQGYSVSEGESPWQLGRGDERLLQTLTQGFADAVRETGRVDETRVGRWCSIARTGAVVGHMDTLALPPADDLDDPVDDD